MMLHWPFRWGPLFHLARAHDCLYRYKSHSIMDMYMRLTRPCSIPQMQLVVAVFDARWRDIKWLMLPSKAVPWHVIKYVLGFGSQRKAVISE